MDGKELPVDNERGQESIQEEQQRKTPWGFFLDECCEVFMPTIP
jgi:hypothetical protein